MAHRLMDLSEPIRKLVRALVVAAALLALGGGMAQARGHGRSSKPAPGCKKDVNCILVPAQCCGCGESGAVKAIPARDKAAEEQARAARCGGTVCVQMMSSDPSCSAKAVCCAGTCTLSTAPAPGRPGKHHRRGHR